MSFPKTITCPECGETHDVPEPPPGKIFPDELSRRVVIECPTTGYWVTVLEE